MTMTTTRTASTDTTMREETARPVVLVLSVLAAAATWISDTSTTGAHGSKNWQISMVMRTTKKTNRRVSHTFNDLREGVFRASNID